MKMKSVVGLLLAMAMLIVPLAGCQTQPVDKPTTTAPSDTTGSTDSTTVPSDDSTTLPSDTDTTTLPSDDYDDGYGDDYDDGYGDDYDDGYGDDYDDGYGGEEEYEDMPTFVKGSPNLDYTGKTIGVLTPANKPSYYSNLIKALRKELNAKVGEISWNKVSTALKADKVDAVIIPDASTVPYGTIAAVTKYLHEGGNLLTLGDVPMATPMYNLDGTWVTGDKYMPEAVKSAGRYIISECNRAKDLDKFGRNAYTGCIATGYSKEIGDYGSPTGTNAMKVTLNKATAWDMLTGGMSSAGYRSLGFYAKGGQNAEYLTMELRENDGARWYATIELTDEWQFYLMGPEDFEYWPWDSTAVDRGGEADRVKFTNVKSMQIGYSASFCEKLPNNVPFTYYLDNVCFYTVAKPEEAELVMEGFSGEYKYYPITNGKYTTTYDNQVFVKERNYKLPSTMVSMHAGTQGVGFAANRKIRFIPLIEVLDKDKLSSGYLAWMAVNSAYGHKRDANGSITACFGTSDPAFYNANGIAAVVDVVRTMLNDSLFVEAGTTERIYTEGEDMQLDFGAYVRSRDMTGVTLDLDLGKNGKRIAYTSFDLSANEALKAHQGVSLFMQNGSYSVLAGQPDTMVMTLKKDGVMIDRIEQEMLFWTPEPVRDYVTVKNGEYYQNGKPLRIFGLNYIPNVGFGFDAVGDDGGYWETWFSDEAYEPEKYIRDIQRMKALGFNGIAVNMYGSASETGRNLMHFVNMLQENDMYIDIFLHGCDYLTNGTGSEGVNIINKQKLAYFDNIVAYDVAWERTFGGYEAGYNNPKGRKMFDGDWETWVVENYGSIANAEKAWGEPMPKNGNLYASPSDSQVSKNTTSRLVAAYRRFLDDLLGKMYNTVRQTLETADPYHLISARAGAPSGTQSYGAGNMVFDAQGEASAFDFYSPEFYDEGVGRNIEEAVFVNYYARFAMPESPVVWKEFGERVWEGSNFISEDDPLRIKALEKQAVHGKRMLEMMIKGHATACYWWIFNGGYRPGEESDCGIVNPDGSDRPVTKVFRAYRDAFMNQPLLKEEADVEILVERDLTASGWQDMWTAIKTEFMAALNAGKSIKLVDAASNTNSSNVPNTAIGLGGKASAKNPARYANAEFQQVYIRGKDGIWARVNYGDTVTMAKGETVEMKVVVCNNMRSEWLSKAKSKKHYVSIVSADKSDIKFKQNISENVAYLEKYTDEFVLTKKGSGRKTVSFRMGIEGRFVFGNPFTFNILFE